MYIENEEIDKSTCLMCLRPFKHSIRFKTAYKIDNHIIKEVEFVINCIRCRNILKQQKHIHNIIKSIKQERTYREWEIFCN